jgi:iron complex transport system substrate-binding protein
LPGLSELVCRLGLEKQLIARSHECDFPDSVQKRPAITAPKYSVEPGDNSSGIHEKVSYLLRNALSVYEVNDERLMELNPNIILTQDHCEVCAVSESDLSESVRSALGENIRIISVSPNDLRSVFASFKQIASALGVPEKGDQLVEEIQNRFDEIKIRTAQSDKPDVVALEWMDPLMTGGNWMPELVEIAGGTNQLSTAGEHSEWIGWETIRENDPDILLLVPCGYSIEKTLGEMQHLEQKTGWEELKAVQQRRVYILDGNHYFNRPGPRLKESAEILAHIFHPSLFKNGENSSGWVQYNSETDQQHIATGSS